MKRLAILISTLAALGILACASGSSAAGDAGAAPAANRRGLAVEADIAVFPQLGHNNHVYSVAYSPDGRYLASGSQDFTLKIWDMKTERELHSLAGHSDAVFVVAYSPDGRRIVSGSYYGTRFWDAETGEELHTLARHSGNIQTVAHSPDELADLRHGAFTYSIVQQLAGRNAARGGIGMLQLSGDVSNDVVRITQDRQHPKPYYQGYHDFFVVE
jgi:hypothetical protein